MDKPKNNKNDRPPNSSLNDSDIKRLRMVFKTVANFQSIPSEELFDTLRKKYQNNGTLSVVSYTLKKFFEETGKPARSEFWGDKGLELSKKVYKEEANNELTNNEINNWKTQEEITEMMNNIPIKDRTDYNRFLLLAMCTFQPPLRRDFYQSVKFLIGPKKPNDSNNYVYLQKHPIKCYYIVNTDKVSRHKKFQADDYKYIEISHPDLCELLRKSYQDNPREYVFESEGGKPYSINTISTLLLERPFKLNFNILRSSYVSNFYKTNLDMGSRETLAQKMRHSVDKALLNYNKPYA